MTMRCSAALAAAVTARLSQWRVGLAHGGQDGAGAAESSPAKALFAVQAPAFCPSDQQCGGRVGADTPAVLSWGASWSTGS